jgi:hypothetical protein
MLTAMHNKGETLEEIRLICQGNGTKGLNLIEKNRSFITDQINEITREPIPFPTSIYMIVGCMSSVEYLKKACYLMLGPNEKERIRLLQASFNQCWNRNNQHKTIGDQNNSVSGLRFHVVNNIKSLWMDTPIDEEDNITIQ